MVGTRRLSALTAVLLVAATGWSAQGAPPRERAISGHVVSGVPGANTTSAAICAWQAGGSSSQGVVGWVVPLSAREGDGHHAFVLHPRASTPFVSALRVTLFQDLGTCGLGAHQTFDYHSGERDLSRPIQRGSRYLVVTMQDAPLGVGFVFFVVPYVVPPGVLQDFLLRITPAPPPPRHG